MNIGKEACAIYVACVAGATAAANDVAVSATNVLPTSPIGSLYLSNRSPLAPSPAVKLPPGAVVPKGWLRRQLELDATGIVGRMAELSNYLKTEDNGWIDPKGQQGWEEMPYWLRGYGDLGYVLNDPQIIGAARKWIDGILACQHPDGYFGPLRLKTDAQGLPDLWPHMLVLDALHAYYEYSGDARVPAFMLKYFRWQNGQPLQAFKVGWGALRWADNMAVIYWLYNKTGEPWLLELAQKCHEQSVDYTTGIPNWHNVNLAQGIREPAEYWMQAREPTLFEATERNYRVIMDTWGQFPGGGFAGDENIRRPFRDPRQGFETCGFVEFMHTFEMMTRISGQPVWSDRCEEIAFNSLPAALTPDHKGLHYITCANCIQLDNEKKGRQFDNQFPMLAYKPGIYDYRCCPHNVGIGWSFYAEELWLATSDRGLCASLYAASEVKAKVADGAEVVIAEETDYPFGDTVALRITVPKPLRFPLYLRVPRWCDGASLKLNGKAVDAKAAPLSYLVLTREWQSGDTVTLALPMRASVRLWPQQKGAASVHFGPLTFSLAIGESWQRCGGTDEWPEYAVRPRTPWNYGLLLDADSPAKSVAVERRPGPLAPNPFVPEAVPLTLRVQAKRIPAWSADRDQVVGVLQQSPAVSKEPTETVSLIPMGAARLRITAFPTIGDGADAHEWVAPQPAPKITASFAEVDRPEALEEARAPATSGDQGVPRFTWWPHKGTAEWVQIDFPQKKTVSGASVYWFDDAGKGGCRAPLSWRLCYRDGDAWRPVEGAEDYGVALDRYNAVSFKPVATTAFRVEVQLRENVSGGLLDVLFK